MCLDVFENVYMNVNTFSQESDDFKNVSNNTARRPICSDDRVSFRYHLMELRSLEYMLPWIHWLIVYFNTNFKELKLSIKIDFKLKKKAREDVMY